MVVVVVDEVVVEVRYNTDQVDIDDVE